MKYLNSILIACCAVCLAACGTTSRNNNFEWDNRTKEERQLDNERLNDLNRISDNELKSASKNNKTTKPQKYEYGK